MFFFWFGEANSNCHSPRPATRLKRLKTHQALSLKIIIIINSHAPDCFVLCVCMKNCYVPPHSRTSTLRGKEKLTRRLRNGINGARKNYIFSFFYMLHIHTLRHNTNTNTVLYLAVALIFVVATPASAPAGIVVVVVVFFFFKCHASV